MFGNVQGCVGNINFLTVISAKSTNFYRKLIESFGNLKLFGNTTEPYKFSSFVS